MNNKIPDKYHARLPVWMDKGEVVRLKDGVINFWQRVNEWISWPLTQTDPLTCTVAILNLIASQYDIRRYNGESLDLFRRRVKYAFLNAKDAGSVAGWKAIFKRLEIGDVELFERNRDIDWDIVLVDLSAEQVSEHVDLLGIIVGQYGRTCRRYRYHIRLPGHFYFHGGYIQGGYLFFNASNYTENSVTDMITRRDRAVLITGHGLHKYSTAIFHSTLTERENNDTNSYTFAV